MIKIISIFFLFLVFSGCSTKKDEAFVQSVFQTNGASAVREHKDLLRDSLLKYQDKLNKRNPSFSSKKDTQEIINRIKNKKNSISLDLLKDKPDAYYQDYLNIAFSKDYVKNRNDYLILGIYKMLYWAYTIDRTHTITTIQYDVEKIQKANKMMQVIQYKVQTSLDNKGNHLFITWQRAWQVEVLQKINNKQEIEIDKYTRKELLYHSNMNFQVISSSMIFTLQESLRYLGAEGTNLSTQAIKSVLMFL